MDRERKKDKDRHGLYVCIVVYFEVSFREVVDFGDWERSSFHIRWFLPSSAVYVQPVVSESQSPKAFVGPLFVTVAERFTS